MILATTSSIPGKKYQVIDVISSFAQCDAAANTNSLNKCMQEARDLLTQRATELKANAVIGIQSSFSELKNIMIYHMQGTAVVYVDLPAKNAKTAARTATTVATPATAATTGGANKQNRKKKNKNANRNKKHQKDQVNQNTRTGGKLSLKEIIENKIKEKEMKKKNKKNRQNRQNKQNQLKTSFANQNAATKKSPAIGSIQNNAQSFKTVKIVRTV
jgi:uncharacterized protein YbjQ (UPF0145 family)